MSKEKINKTSVLLFGETPKSYNIFKNKILSKVSSESPEDVVLVVAEDEGISNYAEKLAKEKGFFVEPMPLQADTNGSGAKGQQTNRMFSFAKKFSTRFCFCNYKDKISLNHIHMLADDDFIGGCWSFS